MICTTTFRTTRFLKPKLLLVIDGVNVGTVRKEQTILILCCQNRWRLTTMQANDANDTYKVMGMMFHKQLSKLLEKKGVVDSQ